VTGSEPTHDVSDACQGYERYLKGTCKQDKQAKNVSDACHRYCKGPCKSSVKARSPHLFCARMCLDRIHEALFLA
jgi:hypothetical protein